MEMCLQDIESHFKYFRMVPEQFDRLLQLVGPRITYQNTKWRNAISAGERLAITLRYLATGDSMQTIAFSYRVGHSTVCQCIEETCNAIWDALMPIYLQSPSTEDELRKISKDFYEQWNFPNCVGAIDGKHVVIQAPHNTGSEYYNYKRSFSIILMAICDANYCFTFIDIGDNGRHSDGGVFSNSSFRIAMEQQKLGLPSPSHLPGLSTTTMSYVFVGDEAFPLRHYMMRPYPGRGLDDQKRIFNYRLSRACRTIENAFGILAVRWRIFRRSIHAHPDKVTAIVKATCCLRNFLKVDESHVPLSIRRYCPGSFVDYEDRHGNITPGDWRALSANISGMSSIQRVSSNSYSQSAGQLRNELAAYFQTPQGKVPWQETILH